MSELTHGTQYTHRKHRAAGEQPCPECARSEADRQRLRRAAACERMQLPVGLIADLYLSAPPELQTLVDNYLSPRVIDTLVERRDAERAAAQADVVDAEVIELTVDPWAAMDEWAAEKARR